MQLSIEVPEQLGYKLRNVTNMNRFIIDALELAFEKDQKKQRVKKALNEIQQQAINNGLSEGILEKLLND